MVKKAKRYIDIDFLRGSAVLFMIFTHVNAVFLTCYDPVLDRLTWWGATVSFTVFLFCFGFLYGLKFAKSKKLKTLKQLKRALILAVIYYLSAISAHFFLFRQLDGRGLLSILTLDYLPPYTEFIISFVLYIPLIIIGQRLFVVLAKKPLVFILFSIGVYVLSGWLYGLHWGLGTINGIKALLVGHGHVRSFGLLSYFPVLALGMVAGRMAVERRRRLVYLMLLTLILGLFIILKKYDLYHWYRFPPSPLFLTYGLIYSMAVLLFYRYIKKIRPINKYIVFLGKNALFIFLANVVVILGLYYFLADKNFTPAYIWILQIVILAAITGVAWIKKALFKYVWKK